KDTTSDPFNQHQYSVAFASYGDGQFGYGEQAAAGWRIGGVPSMAWQFVGIAPCSDLNTSNMYAYGYDKLVVVMPDGAEVELRDDTYDGAAMPMQYYCGLIN